MPYRERELSSAQVEAQPDYRVMIDYIKAQVGKGYEYTNDLVRVVLSERGCYYEFRDLPEEFSGAVGSGFGYRFVGSGEGLEIVKDVHQLALGPESADTHEISLMVIYDWDGLFRSEDSFIYHWRRHGDDEEGPVMSGIYRPGVLPIFFKLKVDSDLAEPLMGSRRGVLFFVAHLSDQHLLVTIPHQGPGVTDLSDVSAERAVH